MSDVFIAQEWQTRPLIEVATLQRGYDLPTQDRTDGPFPIFAANGSLGFHGVAKCKGPGVITGRSGTIGKVHYAEGDYWPLNTSLYVKDFHGNDPRWVYYLLQSFGLERFSQGAGVPTLNRNLVHGEPIRVPPLTEQRHIAAILDQADALKAKRREALAQLDSLTQSIFIEMFGDPKSNPKSIERVSLGSLLKLKSGAFLPSTAMVLGGSYPVFGGNGVNGYHDEFMFDSRQVVIGRVGVYCGCVHVTPAQSWVTDNALYVSEHAPAVEFDFLAFALKQAQLNQYASQSAQPLISGSRIYPVEILLPPKADQLEFIARTDSVAKLAQKNSESLKVLDTLFTSIQHRAFRGEL